MKTKLAAKILLFSGCTLLILAIAIVWQHQRHERFVRQANDTTNDMLDVIDKLSSDKMVFDLADSRVFNSIQKLRDVSYTKKQRDGADQLEHELYVLRACYWAQNLPGSKFDDCLNSTKKINDLAFDDLDLH